MLCYQIIPQLPLPDSTDLEQDRKRQSDALENKSDLMRAMSHPLSHPSDNRIRTRAVFHRRQ